MCRRQLLQSAAPNAMLNIILIKRHQSQYCFVTRSSKLAFCHTIAVMSRGYYLASTAGHRTVAIKVVFILMNMFLITFHKQNIYTTMHHTVLCYNLSSYFTHYLIVAKLTNTLFLTPYHAVASHLQRRLMVSPWIVFGTGNHLLHNLFYAKAWIFYKYSMANL